jgi:phosphoserine phosphatase RsbU/P
VLTELLARARDLLAVDNATVSLVRTVGTELIATATNGLEEEISLALRIPVGAGFAGRIAAGGTPPGIASR